MIRLRLFVLTTAIVLIGIEKGAAPVRFASYTNFNMEERKQELQMIEDVKQLSIEEMKAKIVSYIHENFDMSYDTSLWIYTAVHNASIKYDLPIGLILAIIEKESSFRYWVKNKYGARGLMQVVLRYKSGKSMWQRILINNYILPAVIEYPGCAIKLEDIESDNNILTIRTNVFAGCYILRHYIDQVYPKNRNNEIVVDGYLADVLRRYSGNENSKDRGDDYINKVIANWWKIEKWMGK